MLSALRRVRHVAATSLYGQRRPLHFGNRALVLMTSEPCSARGRQPRFYWLLRSPPQHHAESSLTAGAATQSSIVNFAQGYSKVDRTLATRFKRYEFMCSSA